METNRVLGRAGARLVSDEELQKITGGFQTAACTYDPIACRVLDGDCNSNPPPCLGS
jgi:bacteriocin-like protein